MVFWVGSHPRAPITPNFPPGSSHEIVGDNVENWMLAHHFSHYYNQRCRRIMPEVASVINFLADLWYASFNLVFFCFMFSSFYRSSPGNEACVPLPNLWGSTTKIGVEIEPPFDLFMLAGSACLLIYEFGYIGSPSCVFYCRVWNNWYNLKALYNLF